MFRSRILIFRASVAEPSRIITAIHTRDPHLHIKGLAETATGKTEGELKENMPENVEDRHHYPLLPHLVPREAERPPAGQAEVLKIHNDRIPLLAEIRLAEVNARMPGVAPIAVIIPPVLTVGNLPETVSSIEG